MAEIPPTDGPAEETSGAPVKLMEFSNEHLLKVETYDEYSTGSALKKYIAKTLKVEKPFEGLLRVGKNPSSTVAYFAFDSEANLKAAADLLPTLSYRGKPWKLLPVKPSDLKVTHRGSGSKRPREEGPTGVSSTAPWGVFPYTEQIEKKTAHCQKVHAVMARHQKWNQQATPGQFLGVLSSPVQTQYRNNVTLSFGYTATGTPAIGFNAGAIADGVAAVEPIASDCLTSHSLVFEYASRIMNVYQKFFEQNPELKVYDKNTQQGFWRRLQVRNNVQLDVMLDLELCLPTELSPEKASLVDSIMKAILAEVQPIQSKWPLKSLQYHCFEGKSAPPPDLARQTAFGDSFLTETLCGKKFDLTPTSFFQVNIPATEVLLKEVAEAAELNTEKTILLDLCCGTGTIGICLADRVKRVIGIELVSDAVVCARKNAERNGVSNAVFHAGKIEDLIMNVILSLPYDADIVAILDPPRCGVHNNVIRWIRGAPAVRRLIYVSCEQAALERDSEGFLKAPTKQYRGNAFALVKSFGVDLFPQTEHVEMVAIMARSQSTAPTAPVEAVTASDPKE